MLAHASSRKRILARRIDTHAIHIDFRSLRGIHGSHHDVGRELFTRIKRRLLRNHEGIELVYADVFQVNIRDQVVEHLTLSIAHVALNLGEQRHSGGHGHSLKHILLPVLTHRMGVFGQFCRQVATNDFLLFLIGHERKDAFAELIDCIIKTLAFPRSGGEHHVGGSLQVFLITDFLQVSVAAVGFAHNLFLQ